MRLFYRKNVIQSLLIINIKTVEIYLRNGSRLEIFVVNVRLDFLYHCIRNVVLDVSKVRHAAISLQFKSTFNTSWWYGNIGIRTPHLVVLEEAFEELSRVLKQSFTRLPIVIDFRTNLRKVSQSNKKCALLTLFREVTSN